LWIHGYRRGARLSLGWDDSVGNAVDSEGGRRIEERLSRIEAILLRQEQFLLALPEAICDKLGLKRQ
jgi:hypothetical protein